MFDFTWNWFYFSQTIHFYHPNGYTIMSMALARVKWFYFNKIIILKLKWNKGVTDKSIFFTKDVKLTSLRWVGFWYNVSQTTDFTKVLQAKLEWLKKKLFLLKLNAIATHQSIDM